jgi:hypothetical protein
MSTKRKDLRIARVFFVLALLVLCSVQRHRKMNSLMRAQFIALRSLTGNVCRFKAANLRMLALAPTSR